jgi:predicted nucleic acid-binding protein
LLLYLDTSALVKLYVSERGSAHVQESLRRAQVAATSRVAYPEARSALSRRSREGALSGPGLRRAVAALDADMDSLVLVELNGGVARLAGDLAERHAIRAYDAIHLASALELTRWLGDTASLLTFDNRQADAARAEGLRT